MQSNLNTSVVVENKPGASGTIGAKFVQASPADGQTLLFSASTQALTKLVMANPPYDPWTDFAYVARVGEAPLLMVIAPTLPQTKLKEVMEAAKQNPDKWTAGLPALGAASHLATLMFAKEGNLNLTTTAYKGTAPALTTHEIEAMKVRGVTTTSSPGPILNALSATSNAKVPLANATA